MKKVFCFALVMVLLFVGCKSTDSVNSHLSVQNTSDDILEEYLNNIDNYNTYVREFGEPKSYISMDNKVHIGILYPESTFDFLNGEITKWVYKLVDEYNKQVEGVENEEFEAELAIAYDSYCMTDSFVSIKMSGMYISNTMAHPIDIIKTFNVDLKKGKFINIKDVLKENKQKDFEKLIIDKFNVEPEFVDDKLLDLGLLMKDGIEVILKRGDYLPMSDGTKKIFFKYEEIQNYIIDSYDYKNFEYKEKEEQEDEKVPTNNKNIKIDPQKPMLALTFDDGPSAHTDRLLDIFAKNGGKGTFFVLGNLIDGRKKTLKRIADERHEIGNHSWSHRQLTNLDEKEIKDQIMMTQAIIYDVTGKKCGIMRPPYGSCNDLVKSVGKKIGVAFVNWSIDTLDWKTKNANAIYREIINNASDGAIILCHDLHKTTVDSMEKVVPKLIKDGYQLVTVSQLMSYSKKGFEAGNMYYNK